MNTHLINHIIQFPKTQPIQIFITTIPSNNITPKIFFTSLRFQNLPFQKNPTKIPHQYLHHNSLIYYTSHIPSNS
ncbi:GNAT family N-acetyltransferase [Staphylococcus capitis]|uniref:GNAT family N-acetyltransferase n=1 Tax=Staphylococcus capitis TaxID=29388 RepID=UPI0037099095